MMGKTHRIYSTVFWLGTTGAVNGIAIETGHDPIFNIVVVAIGVFMARPFSSGKFLSPDMDQRWAPGPPRNHYDWRFHRGWTHRVWFATLLTVLFSILPMVACQRVGMSSGIYVALLAPVAGWWSHLSGDMIYGRIKILGSPVGLGWHTGGLSETGRPTNGGKRWLPTNPAERVLSGLAVVLVVAQLILTISAYSA